MQIKYLVREGVSKARVARQLGVSRSTVYNHLKREGAFPKVPERRGSKLDRFKGYIESRLEQFDLPCTVLLQELALQGYGGGLTILRDFVRPLKREFTRRVTERFETVPGRQAQIDWGECGTVEVGGERRKLYVFVMVLGFSRMLFVRFTTSSKLPVLLSCLQEGLRTLGIPKEVLVDNMRQAVEQHDVTTGTVRWNSTFLDFAEHHGFLPVACPPYWPRAKGKVERGVAYVKKSFLEGRAFTDLYDLNTQADPWIDAVANVRVHGTTRDRPIDRYAQEAPALRSFEGVPVYDPRPVELRVVSTDSHISFGGVRYSVHPVAVGHTVTVRPDLEGPGGALTVHFGDRVVGAHRQAPRGSRDVTLAEHRVAIRECTRGRPPKAPRRGPHFIQLPQRSPDVEIRALSTYDRFVEEVAG